MHHPELDRAKIRFKPLTARKDKVFIEQDHVPLNASQSC